MNDKKEDVIKQLTKKYYLKITQDCLEYAPRLADAFIIREQVVKFIQQAVDLEGGEK